MVTTQARSSAAPPDRAGSPAVPPDRAGSPATPPDVTGIFSATLPDESNIFNYVVANVLKQPSDGPLVGALEGAGINEVMDLLTLDHHSRNALTYELDDGTVKPLPLGYKNLLRVLKIFTDYCQDEGNPIEDWTAVTKRDFDDFRTSHAGLALLEKSDAFSISTPPNPIIAPTPSPPAPKQKDLR